MSSQGWRQLYQIIKREARRLPKAKRRFVYSDALIGAMFVWSVWHDRPQCWACQRSSYNGLFRPRRLPSVSEFNKRIRGERFAMLLDAVFAALVPKPSPGARCWLDARPLPVGACSKDRHARPGRVYGGFARGYRVHALLDEQGRVFAWRLTSMNVAEPTVAHELVDQLPPQSTLLADGNYDRAPLHERVAQGGATLLAKPRRNAGRGHRRQSPTRLANIARWNANDQEHTRQRAAVDRAFGWQSSFGGGLAPLPAWVRTPARVHRWVAIKLTIYHMRNHEKRACA